MLIQLPTKLRAIAMFMGLVSCFPGHAAGPVPARSFEEVLFDSVNRERSRMGLPVLRWSSALASGALEHSRLLAQHGTLSHQFPGEAGLAERTARGGARFSSVAENVAEGPSAENIHAQWMNSPPHRANVLDPELDTIGIGVIERGATLFATEDFSLAAEELTLREQEKLVESQLRSRGLRLLDYTGDARKSCTMDNGYAGNHTPSFVLHYASSDLRQLPGMLEQRIRSGRYRAAAVGTCPADRRKGFPSYRIAVLLFE